MWDLRTLRELRTFRGHTKDVLCAAWHPVHEELFASGGYDGGLLYWLASRPGPQARAFPWSTKHVHMHLLNPVGWLVLASVLVVYQIYLP